MGHEEPACVNQTFGLLLLTGMGCQVKLTSEAERGAFEFSTTLTSHVDKFYSEQTVCKMSKGRVIQNTKPMQGKSDYNYNRGKEECPLYSLFFLCFFGHNESQLKGKFAELIGTENALHENC